MINLKIISWNCNSKLREKYKNILEYNADVYVIQECENPKNVKDEEYKLFAKNYVWIGENNNKGLGIFAKPEIKLKRNNWSDYCLKFFLPVNINDKFDILGVWACAPYIEEYYIYQAINIEKFNSNTIIIGDFNSNKIWDKKGNSRNHENVVKQLEKINLVSAYHYINKEDQGHENKKTFCLYRHFDKQYHIDYCFANKKSIKNFEVLDDKEWLKLSDHFPIMVDIQ